MIRTTVTASPLSWPAGWKRAERRQRARFADTNSFRETQEILNELYLMRVRNADVIVSTNTRLRQDGIPYANQGAPADPGAAVWFTVDGEERVLACDRWDRVEHNLRAIARHIAALRGQARWGVGSMAQAFAGFVALPEAAGGTPWWIYFGLEPLETTEAEIEKAYKDSAKIDHPDMGGTDARWHELQTMRRMAIDAVRARRR